MTARENATLRIIVCGNDHRGDDGAGPCAAATILSALPPGLSDMIEIRRRLELRVDDLIDIHPDERCLVIDAVAGPTPGEVVVLPLCDLAARRTFAPRSSHELPIELVLGLASMVRERPVDGTFVGLAGASWDLGAPLSEAVVAGLPAFEAAIADELSRLAGAPA